MTFPTTGRPEKRSGADDSRKQRQTEGTEDDGTVPRPDGVTLRGVSHFLALRVEWQREETEMGDSLPCCACGVRRDG